MWPMGLLFHTLIGLFFSDLIMSNRKEAHVVKKIFKFATCPCSSIIIKMNGIYIEHFYDRVYLIIKQKHIVVTAQTPESGRFQVRFTNPMPFIL
jgi:hypothetical protein